VVVGLSEGLEARVVRVVRPVHLLLLLLHPIMHRCRHLRLHRHHRAHRELLLAELLAEEHDLLLELFGLLLQHRVLLQQRLLVPKHHRRLRPLPIHLVLDAFVDLDVGADGHGARGEEQRAVALLVVVQRWPNARAYRRLRVTPQAISEEASELGIAEGHMREGLVLCEHGDAVAQSSDALVDGLRLLQAEALRARLAQSLAPRQVHHRQKGLLVVSPLLHRAPLRPPLLHEDLEYGMRTTGLLVHGCVVDIPALGADLDELVQLLLALHVHLREPVHEDPRLRVLPQLQPRGALLLLGGL
jgi:hypothetical protein